MKNPSEPTREEIDELQQVANGRRFWNGTPVQATIVHRRWAVGNGWYLALTDAGRAVLAAGREKE